MEQQYTVLLAELEKRINDGYQQYQKTMLSMNKACIFNNASEIIAAKETHYEMCFWIELSKSNICWPNYFYERPLSERDINHLLSLANPFKEFADKWWFYTLSNMVNFKDFYAAERGAYYE